MRSLRQMKILMLMMPVLLSLSGCVYLVIGTLGAMGGYVISPDTVEGLVNHHDETVWEMTVQTLGIMGVIEEKEQAVGMIIAKVQGVKVTISMVAVSRNTTKFTVKARRGFLPKIHLAQDIYAKIVSQLDQ